MQPEQVQAQLSQQAEQVRQLSEQLSMERHSRLELEHQLQQQHALSTVRTPKPPETDGRKPTPEHFAEAFEVYAQQKGIDLSSVAACQLAATFLRDAALDWYVIHRGVSWQGSSLQQLAADAAGVLPAFLPVRHPRAGAQQARQAGADAQRCRVRLSVHRPDAAAAADG